MATTLFHADKPVVTMSDDKIHVMQYNLVPYALRSYLNNYAGFGIALQQWLAGRVMDSKHTLYTENCEILNIHPSAQRGMTVDAVLRGRKEC